VRAYVLCVCGKLTFDGPCPLAGNRCCRRAGGPALQGTAGRDMQQSGGMRACNVHMREVYEHGVQGARMGCAHIRDMRA